MALLMPAASPTTSIPFVTSGGIAAAPPSGIRCAIQSVPGFVSEPEPVIVFNSLSDHAVELNVNFWVDVTKTDPFHAKDDVLLKVMSSFSEQGIELPPPV